MGRSGVTVTLTASRAKWECTDPVVFTAAITPDATNATVAWTGTVDFSIDAGRPVHVAGRRPARSWPARRCALGTSPVVTVVYFGHVSYLAGTPRRRSASR